ncbi:hypothetical protein [Kocuria tytonis]|uniref:Uncharacterized protein n=1 Tax=Kocuria tytonis TaxID=2054280 RepID=A0A495A789_9MICC|nr:hypothetical protein [Kocuria tytonis]RKQ35162.1 hypothetical protein C1C97_007875 [Kocuria tytonis]
MQFNFRRAKTPAYLTSLALVVIGLLLATGSVAVLGWILALLGIALNVMAVSITAIEDSPSRARDTGTRVVVEPETDTEQHDVVSPASAPRSVSARSASSTPAATKGGSSAVRAAAPATERERSAS